jgi:hypothetical protein
MIILDYVKLCFLEKNDVVANKRLGTIGSITPPLDSKKHSYSN